MDALEAVVLGIIQGTSEWLPISSEAQTMLYMLNHLGLEPQTALSYAFFLHIGTALAVLVRFRTAVYDVLTHLSLQHKLTRVLLIATIATAFTALPLYLLLKGALLTLEAVAINTIIGLLLIATGIMLKSSQTESIKDVQQISDRDSLIVGIAQGFAILPGVSRSGVTLSALLAAKIEQETALSISFLLSIPAVFGIILLDFEGISQIEVTTAAILLLTSFSAGYLTMDLLLRFARRITFWIFCIIVGLILVVLGLTGIS
jgi:undecaprenyl-diphosphatase